ncbi:MAG: PQQ-like beta-propeller repeat protein [Chloroflexi bacterium]|nr:PQQ-like beta-propeller repeat protein [Chloroflexota bacterium]
MKKKRTLLLVAAFAGLSLLLSACGGRGFVPTSWAGLTLSQSGENLYVANNLGIYVLDPVTGRQQQIYPAEPIRGASYYAAPVLTEDGQLLAAAYNNRLYSFDLATRALLWEFSEARSRFIASPLVLDDVIYAPNADGTLYALNMAGEKLAEFETGEGLWATPTTDGSAIYLTSMDGRVYSLAARTLRENWSVDTGAALVSTPLLDPETGLLYVGNFAGDLLGLDLRSGRIAWQAETEGWIWGPPALADGVLYLGDLNGNLYAFEAGGSTQPLWQTPLDGQIAGAPLVTEDSLYIGTGAGKFYALDLDGVIRYTDTVDEVLLLGTPLLVGDLILVGKVNGDEVLIAYDRNLNDRWVFVPEN